ncbi:hypothetical protein AQUCO_04200091v1 [Aquilegia coerulea]|uniref:Syntaxin 6/10/61 N-terminal domain-containing protein n=1 Tax=Aquilegia coerulea TaxID=218851 RepID=A0A2G5CP97_AQUCA|nr:hypothetical protein AQUCO_04200091v1 [Aquilegia coerulea]
MATNFDRWEKDPFFSAAEEVQESADRMESTYRTWIHETKDNSSVCDPNELRRDLQTALGTAKWQLEEFERAVRSSYVDNSAKDAKTRHCQFIDAIRNQIDTVENSLKEFAFAEGKSEGKTASLPWVRLDEGERDELALFLSGSPAARNATQNIDAHTKERRESNTVGAHEEMMPDCSKNSCQSAEKDLEEPKEDKLRGHRRTASASADIGSWKIAVGDEQRKSSDGQPDQPLPRIVSFSGFLSTMEPMTKIKSSKNGFRKWKLADRHQATDTLPLQSQQLSRDIDACYERSKSCLDSCDETYNKHLYGWLGAVQRQLQRSQYQIQYSRPVQVAMWVAVAICMLVIFALRVV